MDTIKVMQVGLGPIGQKAIQFLMEKKHLQLVAAVDSALDKVGQRVKELCSLDLDPGVKIVPDLASALQQAQPDVALVTTISSLKDCAAQLEEIVQQKIHVVSTCEEMAYPWITQPEISRKLDETAKQNSVALVGTGVNPAFLMDFLPAVLTGICRRVDTIKVSRHQDASIRRVPFQQKIGAALTPEEFETKKQTGTLGHVGLTESLHLIAAALGWTLDKTEDILSPVIAEKPITSGYKPVESGMAAGVRQFGNGYKNGREVITLEFIAVVGQSNPGETIEIKGEPNLTSTIPGGVNGDLATCAVAVNAISSIVRATPGLHVMTDLPTVSCFDVDK